MRRNHLGHLFINFFNSYLKGNPKYVWLSKSSFKINRKFEFSQKLWNTKDVSDKSMHVKGLKRSNLYAIITFFFRKQILILKNVFKNNPNITGR